MPIFKAIVRKITTQVFEYKWVSPSLEAARFAVEESDDAPENQRQTKQSRHIKVKELKPKQR